MPATITEHIESRRISTGPYPSAELRYTVRGTNDEIEARSAVLGASPTEYDPWGSGLLHLPRETIAVEPIGHELWQGVVYYGTVPQTNESTFAFDTGGGVQHITQSLQTVGRYAPPGVTAPDFKGAIGVTADSVAGVDIAVPVYQFSETHYLPNEAVTNAYKGALFRLTGKVNGGAFRGLEAGECLFIGASGAKRGVGDWEITFRFAGSPNADGLTVGEIAGINKKGWEYLWVRYADSVDETANMLVKRPIVATVERVYEYGNFGLLGI